MIYVSYQLESGSIECVGLKNIVAEPQEDGYVVTVECCDDFFDISNKISGVELKRILRDLESDKRVVNLGCGWAELEDDDDAAEEDNNEGDAKSAQGF